MPTNITPLSQLPLSDDFMFGEVMRQPKVCQLFLESLLGKDIARIEYISKQEDLTDDVSGHGIRLDVYLNDVVPGSNAILFLRHPAVLDTVDNKLSSSRYFTVHATCSSVF